MITPPFFSSPIFSYLCLFPSSLPFFHHFLLLFVFSRFMDCLSVRLKEKRRSPLYFPLSLLNLFHSKIEEGKICEWMVVSHLYLHSHSSSFIQQSIFLFFSMTFKMYTVLPSSPQESLPISQIFYRNGRVIAVNLLIVIFLICYTLVGGLVFLHFEANFARFLKEKQLLNRRDCIQRLLRLVTYISRSSLFSHLFSSDSEVFFEINQIVRLHS